jgi:DDE family transposase
MPAIHKRRSRIRLECVANDKASVHGGLPAVEALCEQFGLWDKLRALSVLDPRRRKNRGYSPEVIVVQLIYSFTWGGISLADAEDLTQEPLAKLLARVGNFADQSTVGEWLRAQTPETVAAFWGVVREFVAWVLGQADPRRWTYCGRGEVFFDDTQLEVYGPSFQGAKINYEGHRALSWQTMWLGPLLVDGELDSPADVSAALPAMLARNRGLWADRATEFLADSGSSAGVYLEAIRQQNFAQWSVSYNKWVGPLERTAAGLPEAVWGPVRAARWRDGSPISEQHGFLRHQPEGWQTPLSFAVVRFRRADEMFWNYRFVVCDENRTDAAAVFARHHLKGEKELLLKEVLRGLDLHHPPCQELNANRMFYAIAALAYNVLAALKLLHLPDDCQGWQLKTLLSKLLLLPTQLVRHARVLVARVQVPAVWLAWRDDPAVAAAGRRSAQRLAPHRSKVWKRSGNDR